MLSCWLLGGARAQQRYVKLGLAKGTPAAVLCSVTATSPVSDPAGLYPPHLLLNDEKPASNSMRFVAGDDHVACVIFSRSGHMLPDSGAVVVLPRAIQSSPRLRQPSPVLTSADPVQLAWYSQ